MIKKCRVNLNWRSREGLTETSVMSTRAKPQAVDELRAAAQAGAVALQLYSLLRILMNQD
jgi:hypothetical protein